MRHNKLFLTVVLISTVLISCTSTDGSPVSGEEERSGQTVSEVSANNGKEAGASSPVQEDSSEDQAIEEATEPAEQSSGPIEEIESPSPLKEARKGGRKASAPVEEDIPAAAAAVPEETGEPDEIIPGLTSANAPVQIENPPADEKLDELVIEEIEPAISEATEDLNEVVNDDMGMDEDESEGERDYSITVVNELSMDPQSSDLPSEMDQIDYNPLLPVVVDAPSVRMESEEEKDSEPDTMAVEPETPSAVPSVPPVLTATEPETTGSSEDNNISDIEAEELENLYVDGTGKLIIELQGTGWIYISSDENDGLSLKDKSFNPDNRTTRFVFTSSSSTGPEGKLVFMKQDLLRGESSQKSLDLEGRLSPEPESGVTTAADDSGVADYGMEPAASAPADPDVSTAAAEPDPTEQSATEATVTEPVAPEAELPEDAAGLLRLAERYEAPGPEQSLEKALKLYNRIKIEFPVTEERFIAETRIRYLNKHYFKVQ